MSLYGSSIPLYSSLECLLIHLTGPQRILSFFERFAVGEVPTLCVCTLPCGVEHVFVCVGQSVAWNGVNLVSVRNNDRGVNMSCTS